MIILSSSTETVKDSATGKIISNHHRSKVTIENQSQVVEQFEDDVLPIAGIMSLKSLNINSDVCNQI